MDKEDFFLGRCQYCLDNAFANDKCNYGIGLECLVRRYQEAERQRAAAIRALAPPTVKAGME